MKNNYYFGFKPVVCSTALFLASCTGLSAGPIAQDNGGLSMGVGVTGLTSDQSFCFSWTLFQEDSLGGWEIIDQREDEVCGDPGDLSVSDFATCYDGLHFLIQYDITVYGPNGEIDSTTATSGGGPTDICVKNTDIDSTVNIQFNNSGSAGGINPGIDIDLVCSNDKVQLEDGELVSALWLQSDSCVLGEEPDSYCVLGSGSGIETSRTDITVDGSTRFIFSTSDQYATWDLLYLAFEPDLDTTQLTLLASPFALHHFADNGAYGREELTDVLTSYRFGDSVGIVNLVGGNIVVTYDLSATCDGDIDLGSYEQVIPAPTCPGGCEAVGAIATGGSTFEIVFNCDGDIVTVPCDALGGANGVCN